MILQLISSAFAGVGIAVVMIGTVRTGNYLFDKIQAASMRKRERNDQIIATLNRIENRLNNPRS